MDRDLRRIFGDPMLDLLAEHGFAERFRYDDENGLARDYANRDFGIQLTSSMQGKCVFVMPRNDLHDFISRQNARRFHYDRVADST
jgi:hypothetical protein